MDCPAQVRDFVAHARRTGWRAPPRGGLADGTEAGRFDADALARGLCVELEHTGSWPVALGIAMDHLSEHARYYDALAVMEAQLERNPWYRSWWLAVPVAAAAAGVGAWFLLRGRPGPLGPAHLCSDTFDSTGGVLQDVEYSEFRPPGVGHQAPLPMVILLVDGDPSGIVQSILGLPVASRVIVPRPIEEEDGVERWFGAARGEQGYAQDVGDAAAHLATFVEQISHCVPTKGLPAVAGYDRGADVAFALGADVPGAISGVVGAAGFLPPALGPIVAPTTAIHGRDDDVVPYWIASDIMLEMIGSGAPITWVPMTGVDHSFAGALQVRWLQALADQLGAQAAR